MSIANSSLPEIPNKRYFAIGEVSELCDVKPHVLRYWEQEFATLSPVKRRGNRRYYQKQDVVLVRTIRQLLYGEGYTISGARARIEGASADCATEGRQSTLPVQKLILELEDIATLLKP
ncbi:MAG: MerR family transcriptional regulator [Gammaproteobacteria bacterium]|nr:MerR family transcriptional regulator [Gammaproteobacteria bacterium]